MKHLQTFESKENKRRFVGEDGEFVPSPETQKIVGHPKKEGVISIGYLEELLEYLYYHDNMSDEDKLKSILDIEKMIQELLDDNYPMKINYKPKWSKKLKK